jgi:hypothetical protein
LGRADLDSALDKADHTLVVLIATIDPIYQWSLEFDSEGGREVYMVGNREELPEKTVEEIQREADEEIARAAHLARKAKRGKRHHDLQDDLGASNDEPRDAALMRRHHPTFNSWCPTDRDWLRNWSRSIREEIGWIEY